MRVLKIGIRNYKSRIEYINYLFTEHTGIYEFLEYYESKIKAQNASKIEGLSII